MRAAGLLFCAGLLAAFAVSSLPAPVARAQPATVDPGDARIEQRLGAQVPLATPLRLANGETVTAGAMLRGRPVILVLAYSSCPTLCNLALREMAQATKGTETRPGRDYDLLTVSIDPEESVEIARGTESRLLAAAGLAPESGGWRYMLGSQDAIFAIADAVGFRFTFDPRTKSFVHPAAAFVLTPDGRVSRYLLGLRHEPAEIDDAVRAAAEGRIAEPAVFTAATICFELEPSGRRSQAVRWGLRGLGVTVMAALVALVVGFRGPRRAS